MNTREEKRKAAHSWGVLVFLGVTALSLAGCKKKNSVENGSDPDPSQDTGVPCQVDADCNDGAFCNGIESCFEGTCHAGTDPRCDDGIECTEDKCSHAANNCVFAAPDEDGDGYADASCLGPDGEALGEDCDDNDPDRYPGNAERCSLNDPEHDEDCDPRTFGHLDNDSDGVVDERCCNTDGDSKNCGTDCDDEQFHRYPNHAEICDNIDNDCNGEVDDDTREVAWYPDDDGDNFGQTTGDVIMSCAPIEDHSLRPTDCDDSSPGVHSAAIEACDGFDNNCDGEVDEGGVCACSPDGKAQPCACDGTRTGVQLCDAGLWSACECDECVEGEMDCVAGILPRLCKSGLWEFQNACTGQFSECNAGICTCPGGGTECPPPVIYPGGGTLAMLSTVPTDAKVPFDTAGAPSITFSEDINPATTAGVQLFETWGQMVDGSVSVMGATVTFTPSSPLNPGMGYRLEVPVSLASVSGNTWLAPIPFEFNTATGLLPETFTSDPNLKYNKGRLAMSRGGTLIALLREETVSPYSERTVVRNYSAGWTAPEELTTDWPIDGWDVAVDDTGWANAIAYDGANVARYDRQGAAWLGPVVSPAANGGVTPNLTVLNGSGRGFYVFENTSMALELVGRTGGGLYDSPVTTPMFGDFGRAAAIGLTGEAAVATQSSMSLMVWHSDADLANFAIDTLDTDVRAQDVAVGDDGVKYVVYSKNISAAVPPDQVYFQSFEGSWSGPMDVLDAGSGGGDELDPQIGVDSAGNVHILFTKNGRLTTAMRPSTGGAFSDVIEISRPDAFTVLQYQLKVAPSGDAVIAWTQYGNFTDDLWAVRYRSGVGWGHPRLLEDAADPIGAFDLAVDGVGTAHVLFEVNTDAGTESMSVIVP